MKDWRVVDLIEEQGEVHGIPNNDDAEHIESAKCFCKPFITEETEDGVVLMYHALDLREVIEQAEELINKNV